MCIEAVNNFLAILQWVNSFSIKVEIAMQLLHVQFSSISRCRQHITHSLNLTAALGTLCRYKHSLSSLVLIITVLYNSNPITYRIQSRFTMDDIA